MASQAVYGIVSNRTQAETIIQALVDAGVKSQDISFLTSQRKEFQDFNPDALPSNRNWRTEERLTDFPGKRMPENMRDTAQSTSWSGNERQGGLGTEKHTKAPEGATTGGVAGGIIGGTLGLLVGIGTLAIPGLGPFIAAGPLMTTLAGLGAGGTVGGIIGALVGAGIPEYEAKRYENRLRQGGILLSIHANTNDLAKHIKEILQKNGAEDVSISSEAVASKNYKNK
jgi:hypothetical protein